MNPQFHGHNEASLFYVYEKFMLYSDNLQWFDFQSGFDLIKA